jgi:hypothetical protein
MAQIKEIKGTGIISVNIEKLPTINFYKNKNDNHISNTIEVFDDETIKSYNIRNLDSISITWFKPMHVYLDYFIFDFQCSVFDKDWIQVVVNEDTNLKYWIKNSTVFKYTRWDDYISNVFSVRPLDKKNNPMLTEPKIDAKKCIKQPIDCLMPVEAIGDWIKVIVEPPICDETVDFKEEEIFEGYIRWKKGKRLIIDYYLTL